MEENFKMMSVERFVNLEKEFALQHQDLKLQLNQRDKQIVELGKQLNIVKELQGLDGESLSAHGFTDFNFNIRDGLSQNTTEKDGLGKHYEEPRNFGHLRTNLTNIQFPQEINKSILPKVFDSSLLVIKNV